MNKWHKISIACAITAVMVGVAGVVLFITTGNPINAVTVACSGWIGFNAYSIWQDANVIGTEG